MATRHLLSSVTFLRVVVIGLLVGFTPGVLMAQGNGNGGSGGGTGGGGITPQAIDPPGGGNERPEVHIIPTGGTFADSLVDVTIYWCDDEALKARSRIVKHGTSVVTSSYDYQNTSFAEPCNVIGDIKKSEGTINLKYATSVYGYIQDTEGKSGSETVNYTYEPEIPPLVWTSYLSEGYWRPTQQVANGFEMAVSHTTPGYTFKGTRRNLTFVYRGDQAKPRVLVQVKVSSGGANPDEFSMKVKDPTGSFMTFLNNNSRELFWDGTQSTVMLGGVVDASGLGTGAHDLTVLVRSHFGGSYEETVDTVRALVVDESNSPYGEGWSIAGIQTAYEQTDGSVVVTEGDGSALYFEKDGASFTAPNGDFSELVTSGSGWKRIYANGDTVAFDANGRMTQFAPRHGYAGKVSYSYGASGELTGLDPYQSFAINTNLVFAGDSITVQEGNIGGTFRTTVLRLNVSDRVTSIEGPDGNDELSFGYTGGRITSVTDRRGKTTDYTYDALGYLASAELPQISVSGQNVRPEIEQQSLAITLGPDSIAGDGTSGNPATAVLVANARPWVEDARDARTYFTLDPYGFRTAATIEEPLGRTTTVTHNTKAQVTRVDRPSGAYSSATWSGPRLTSAFESTTGRAVTYQYANPPESNSNQPIRVYDNKGSREIWYDYGSNDRLSGVYYDTIGFYGDLIASYTYLPGGELYTGTDSDTGHLVRYEYDPLLAYANLKTVKPIRGSDTLITRFKSDDYGRRVKTIDPAGDSTFMAYDDLDRILWAVNALGDTTYVESYDGYLADTLRNARGKVYSSTYNALGWVTQTTDPESGTSTVGYDENGNVVSAIDRLGNEASFGYDSLNLPTFQEVEGDTIHVWTDPGGTKSAAWNGVSADTTEYDDLGRPTKSITRRGAGLTRRYVIRSAYDDDGPRNRVWVYSPGTIDYDMRYTWNDEGRLTKISDYVPGTAVHTEFGYNDHFQLDTMKIAGTARMAYDYSDFHPGVDAVYLDSAVNYELGNKMRLDSQLLRLNQLQSADGDTIRFLSYDATGQVTAVRDSAYTSPTCEANLFFGWHCTGDSTQVQIRSASFSYDAVGNRTDSGASVTNGNRLLDMAGYFFARDAEGRTLTKTDSSTFWQTYHWSDRGQIDSVTTIDNGDTTVVKYAYDGLGRRISRTTGSNVEEYLYDGAHVIVTLDGNQNVLRTFSYYPGVDKPHSLMTSNWTYYYAVDPTGSVVGLVEYSGNPGVVNHYRYDVWGMPQGTALENVSNPIRFKSRWWDPDTKLVDFRSRWYDPEIGRFISEDPIGLAGGINVFTFAGNNPIAGQDPFGLAGQEMPSSYTGPDGCAVYEISSLYTGCRAYYGDPLVVSVGPTWGTVFDPWYIGPEPDYTPGPGPGRSPPGGGKSGGGAGGGGGGTFAGGSCPEGQVVAGGHCSEVLIGVVPDFIGPPEGAMGRLLGRPYPCKIGSCGRLQPYDPATGRYLSFEVNQGLRYSPAAFAVGGFGRGFAAGVSPSPSTVPVFATRAEAFGWGAGYFVGNLLGPLVR